MDDNELLLYFSIVFVILSLVLGFAIKAICEEEYPPLDGYRDEVRKYAACVDWLAQSYADCVRNQNAPKPIIRNRGDGDMQRRQLLRKNFNPAKSTQTIGSVPSDKLKEPKKKEDGSKQKKNLNYQDFGNRIQTSKYKNADCFMLIGLLLKGFAIFNGDKKKPKFFKLIAK